MKVEPSPSFEEYNSPTFDRDKPYWCRCHDFLYGYFVEYVSYNESRVDGGRYRIFLRDLEKHNKKIDDMSHEERIEFYHQLQKETLT